MILYFADRKMNILGLANTHLPEGYLIIDDLKREEVDTGIATFTCTLAYDDATRTELEAMTEAGNFILRSNATEKEFYTIIDSEIDSQNKEINIYAEDAGLDLINEIVGEYAATEAHTAAWYISYFTADTGFEIGINEIPATTTRKLSWEGESTVTERLASIANSFGGFEISYSFEVDKLEITKKYINIYQQRGKDVGEILMMHRDIDRIITKKSVANLATALQVEGGTPENAENPITLDGYTYDDGDIYVDGSTLKCRSALQKWGRFVFKSGTSEGHIVKQYSYDTTSQSELCNRAITELKKICDKEITYEVDVNSLPDSVKIGDRINVVDDASNLYFSARVLILETSVIKNKQSATLGEYLHKDSGIAKQVEELAEQVKNINTNGLSITIADVVEKDNVNAVQSAAVYNYVEKQVGDIATILASI